MLMLSHIMCTLKCTQYRDAVIITKHTFCSAEVPQQSSKLQEALKFLLKGTLKRKTIFVILVNYSFTIPKSLLSPRDDSSQARKRTKRKCK